MSFISFFYQFESKKSSGFTNIYTLQIQGYDRCNNLCVMMNALVIKGDVFTVVTTLFMRNCWSMLCNVPEEDLVF